MRVAAVALLLILSAGAMASAEKGASRRLKPEGTSWLDDTEKIDQNKIEKEIEYEIRRFCQTKYGN